jgi:scyllo-inosamine 4-kinase
MADQYRDPARIAQCARIAARIFERHRVDWATAQREGGWSNATWSAEGLVLRIAVEAGTQRMVREARLASLLPPEVGYPPVVEMGVTEGLEWMLAERVAGHNLGAVWPALHWESRIAALEQLWAKARAIHSVDPALAQAHTSDESPFVAPNTEAARAQVARLEAAGVLAPVQAAVLSQILDRFWAAMPSAPRVLNHGDLCTENALWENGRVVALLDLEYAIVAPVELDVHELVKCGFAPPERPDPLPDPDGSGQARLRRAVADIAAATMSTPEGADRLLGFSLLVDMWLMETELSIWDGAEPYVDWGPYRALVSLADGAGGYLAPVLARLERAR